MCFVALGLGAGASCLSVCVCVSSEEECVFCRPFSLSPSPVSFSRSLQVCKPGEADQGRADQGRGWAGQGQGQGRTAAAELESVPAAVGGCTVLASKVVGDSRCGKDGLVLTGATYRQVDGRAKRPAVSSISYLAIPRYTVHSSRSARTPGTPRAPRKARPEGLPTRLDWIGRETKRACQAQPVKRKRERENKCGRGISGRAGMSHLTFYPKPSRLGR